MGRWHQGIRTSFTYIKVLLVSQYSIRALVEDLLYCTYLNPNPSPKLELDLNVKSISARRRVTILSLPNH